LVSLYWVTPRKQITQTIMSHNSNIIRNKDETTTMRWNAASSTPSTYDTKNTTRSEEQCGFVIHVTVVLLSLSYTIWILQFYMDPYVAGSSGTPQTAPQQQQLSLSPPAWTVVLPTLLVVLFWAAPVAYGFVNAGQAAAAVSQKRQTLAMTVLQDGTTRVAPPLYTAVPKQRGHKTSDNGHTNTMQEYLQRPLETVSAASATTTAGSRHQGQEDHLPDVCDIDVACINDWVWRYRDTTTTTTKSYTETVR
jgi:hypothetical protein